MPIRRPVTFRLAMLKDELELRMAMAICQNITDISRNHIRTQHDKDRF